MPRRGGLRRRARRPRAWSAPGPRGRAGRQQQLRRRHAVEVGHGQVGDDDVGQCSDAARTSSSPHPTLATTSTTRDCSRTARSAVAVHRVVVGQDDSDGHDDARRGSAAVTAVPCGSIGRREPAVDVAARCASSRVRDPSTPHGAKPWPSSITSMLSVAVRLVDLHSAMVGSGVPRHVRHRLGDDPECGLLHLRRTAVAAGRRATRSEASRAPSRSLSAVSRTAPTRP